MAHFQLIDALEELYPRKDITSKGDAAVELWVPDVRAISWQALDRVMRKALDRSTSPGMLVVAVDGTRTVIYEALVVWSRREDVTRISGPQEHEDTPEQAARRCGPDDEMVSIRSADAPFIGVRRAARRAIAVASYVKDGEKHVISIGTADTEEDAARMRDLYVLGLWFDRQIGKAPTLNFPPDQYQDLWADVDLTTHHHEECKAY